MQKVEENTKQSGEEDGKPSEYLLEMAAVTPFSMYLLMCLNFLRTSGKFAEVCFNIVKDSSGLGLAPSGTCTGRLQVVLKHLPPFPTDLKTALSAE